MDPTGPVVVGYDGSEQSRLALDWAVEEARRRGAGLRVVHAAGLPSFPDVLPSELAVDSAVREHAEGLLAEAEERVRTVAPEVPTAVRLHVGGSPAQLLTEESRSAALAVVGSRGRGGFASLLLGSTSTSLAMHSACPVVVVHAPTAVLLPPDAARPVVVGVDGSELSMQALAFAFQAAAARGATLRAVHTWTPPVMAVPAGVVWAPQEWEPIEQAERALLAESVEVHAAAHPEVAVEQEVLRRHPADALIDESRAAELVVLGSRGRGGFAGLLLGSVSQAVIQHASCPVAVIRPGP